MSKKRTKKKIPTAKILISAGGVVVICFSAIALLGFFSEGGAVGNGLADLFKLILGRLAWLGPFITGTIGFLLMLYNPAASTQINQAKDGEVADNPGGNEIVSKGRGFNRYFSDLDPLNENKPKSKEAPALEDLGRDFGSYFGNSSGRTRPELVSIGGRIPDYFTEEETACAVAQEETVPASKTSADSQGKIKKLSLIRVEERGKNIEPVTHSEQLTLETDLPEEEEKSPVPPGPNRFKEVMLPPVVLLDPASPSAAGIDSAAQQNARLLEEVLNNFGVKVKVTDISQGPAITRYEVQPAPGIKISRIVSLADDMALALAAPDVRIEAPIPGKSAVGIEVPNKKITAVKFREVLEAPAFNLDSKLKVALGKDIAGNPIVVDLTRMPHLLVAGATGSGKSVCMNTIITSILYTAKPDEVKFLLIDPKMVELTKYNHVPHLIAPVVTDPKKAAVALRWIISEMETRYELFAGSGVRDIVRYNEVNQEQPPLPYIVVLIDELADLMMVAPGDVEEAICRLAQMARAAGIHLVVATQRPSVDVITGIIKANIPSRIAFAVSSQIDSRTILDGNGAEKLLGKGDMLYYPLGMAKPLRVQGCFLSDQEVERVARHWKSQAQAEYLSPDFETNAAAGQEEGADDELFYQAGHLFVTSGIASVSLLQRRLRVGYTRAARLMDLLEDRGVVGSFEGSKPRQVLMSVEEFEERFTEN